MKARRPIPSEIILASASPRRKELLEQIGIAATVVPSKVDEARIRHDDPVELAIGLARAKAIDVAESIARAARGVDEEQRMPILGADTLVVVAGAVLEKPAGREDAARMLRLLSGRTHQVITGIALIPNAGSIRTGHSESHVTFARLTDPELEVFLESREWVGVAGAYRIQGIAARHITHLSGSYSNVVGLPLHLVYSILTA
jgi:septum formation protein